MLKPEARFKGFGCKLGIEEAMITAIDYLGDTKYEGKFPELADVEAEWTGHRGGVSHLARRPDITEYEQYRKLMQEVEPDSMTVLYFHGGAFWYVSLLLYLVVVS